MLQRRKILISFLAITVLQGITYPAIALGSESNAMQVSSNSQTAEPNQNSNSIQGGDSTTITSDADDASQFSDSASESTQPNSVIHSSRQNRNDDRPDSSEPDKNNDSTSPNEPTKPDKPENGWDQNKEHYHENGTMAVSKDVFISSSPNNRKDGIWVRFDENGNLVKGEDHRNGGWYYFDEETGAMAKGVKTYPPTMVNGCTTTWSPAKWRTAKPISTTTKNILAGIISTKTLAKWRMISSTFANMTNGYTTTK